MPLGDDKHKLIYEELINILGSDYVSDDPNNIANPARFIDMEAMEKAGK